MLAFLLSLVEMRLAETVVEVPTPKLLVTAGA